MRIRPYLFLNPPLTGIALDKVTEGGEIESWRMLYVGEQYRWDKGEDKWRRLYAGKWKSFVRKAARINAT